MSRPLRIEYPGAFYHVMNRGTERKPIFLDPLEDRALFLRVLGEAADLWKIRIHAYSLMGNHYHLLIETPLPNLSRAMRHIDGVYTQRLNRKVGRDGPLFRGRFKSILVQKESYFLELVRYIHLNGVRAMEYPDPRLDPNCSHSEYLGTKMKKPWLMTELALSFFEPDKPDAHKRLDAYVRAGVSKELEDILAKKQWPSILGLKDFKLEIKQRFRLANPAHREKPQERELAAVVKLEPTHVLVEVAKMFGVLLSDLQRSSSRIHSNARLIAIHLLRHTCYMSYGEIGKVMGGIGSSAVLGRLKQVQNRNLIDEKIRRTVRDKLGIQLK